MSEPITTVTLESLIDANGRYSVAALRAVKALARSKPWQGTRQERWDKAALCFAALKAAYASRVPADLSLREEGPLTGCSGGSHYHREEHVIVLRGRLSVVTMFQLFAYARGLDVFKAQRWAATLFHRCFPLSFSRCRLVGGAGGLIVNDGRRDD